MVKSRIVVLVFLTFPSYLYSGRFLESTNCVGMCTNLCKIPCQKFIQDSLGTAVYMSPSKFICSYP